MNWNYSAAQSQVESEAAGQDEGPCWELEQVWVCSRKLHKLSLPWGLELQLESQKVVEWTLSLHDVSVTSG